MAVSGIEICKAISCLVELWSTSSSHRYTSSKYTILYYKIQTYHYLDLGHLFTYNHYFYLLHTNGISFLRSYIHILVRDRRSHKLSKQVRYDDEAR